MIKRLAIALRASRDTLERVRIYLGDPLLKIEEYPVRSVLRLKVIDGSPEHLRVQSATERFDLDVDVREAVEASPGELDNEPIFVNRLSRWIDDSDDAIDIPSYTAADICDKCGRGAMRLSSPLKGEWGKFRKRHFLRYPPALIIVSSSFAATIERTGWTGASLRPLLERSTGKESKQFVQLGITSMLPPMHPSALIERSPIPEFCAACRKLGYRLKGVQPSYSRDILACAADFNFSSEWLAEHYVSCPQLICSRAVVSQLLKLEPAQGWIPIQWT